jgi:hypothetical protein
MDNLAYTYRSFRGYGTISGLIVAGFFVSALCLGIAAQDSRLKVNQQPLPELPKNYGTLDVQGTVLLRVQFLDIGEIGEIVPVVSVHAGLTERAIAAARKIKFDAEKKDGKSVTVVKSVQYFYSWNGGWRIPVDNTESVLGAKNETGKADAVLAKAVQALGGDRYLQVKSQIGRGKFSEITKEGVVVSFRSFVDVIVYPNKERTEFKGQGLKNIQVNVGDTGWVFDGSMEVLRDQNETQIANFRKGIRTSLDHLLRGEWKSEGKLSYVTRRAGSLGRRNDVMRLTYNDGLVVEFEFGADDGLPVKAMYKRTNADGEDIKEEDRYAQFIETDGIKVPFVVDHYTNGKMTSRINYESIEFNKPIPESIFTKPANPKQVKELKL